MIEKRITEQLLEAGELILTPREREALKLPEHSTTVEIELDGETFGAQWNGRSRKLSGDTLSERLCDYGQVNGLLRFAKDGNGYRLSILPPGSAITIDNSKTPQESPSRPADKPKFKRRPTVDRQFQSDDKYDWGTGKTRTVGFLAESRNLLADQLKAAGFDPLEMVELRLQGEELATLDDFEELLSVDVSNVDRMPHQAAAARHALSRLRGRAILADEVGLGKTIETGLAMKELTLRGLAKRVLVLCPAPLRDQWREEMDQKFDLRFDVAYGKADIGNQEKLIMSLPLALKNMEKLTAEPWDIIVLDEAHRAAGAGARKTRELVTRLTTACRYAFFLTATPVQNDLVELYRLVELLRPGTFKSESAFRAEYMASYDSRTPRDPAGLRRLISSAMIRTTRAQAGVDRVVRRAVDVPIDLGPRERELYALSTDLLRNIMRSPGDAMRRRSLALRLTASPFSMGTTALRMAARHNDEHVRKVLNEVGHLAMDITSSAREDRALQITRDWVREHGRVLIFTQHTDTVTGLLRRIESEGLTARAFHGSMSAGERAATISSFRSGEAPIMISTDAGAEGQNLQFCNCVLNYDLPWNPMRIEQRIGRVDRLTQPRDEVFVANLYARDTIDANVYFLLAEKLRMFELLFGQVTTILGEIDDSKSATFESRVLGALFAENDSKMEQLLGELGTELAGARERASTLIAADSGLSSWMASAFEHREGLTKAGSSELAPEISERARIRQRSVQSWVRRVLKALNAEILHDTGEGDGAFLTAKLDDEVGEELGGRTLLHLAFDRHGLDNHPAAELCAVGSPVFDELLGLLRMRGDMHATVPVIPEDPGPSPLRHAPSTTLVRRRLVPSGTWSGHATFRATVGEAETTEHIITSDIAGGGENRMPRRPLDDGEPLPSAFGMPKKVITEFEQEAARQLEVLRRERTEKIAQEQARERERIRGGYQAQIAEAYVKEDRERLQRALRSEEQRLNRQPDVRARAKLLAFTLDEDDWLVEEIWRGPGDSEVQLTYDWNPLNTPYVVSDASDKKIRNLALCSHSHCVDKSEVTVCGSCDRHLCSACGSDATFRDCSICSISICKPCSAEHHGLCNGCATPQRTPELDEEFAVGWRLNNGRTLLVGERVALLNGPRSSDQRLVVPGEDLSDPDRRKMRAYAVSLGLPADSGLELRNYNIPRQERGDLSRLSLQSSSEPDVQISIGDGQTSAITTSAVRELPPAPDPAVKAEAAVGLADLLERLRREVPPPPPPAVVVTRRIRTVDVYLEADRIVEEVALSGENGTTTVAEQNSAPLQWHAPDLADATVAEGRLGDLHVTLSRRNDAILVKAGDREWLALNDGQSAGQQLEWFEHLQSRGTPGGRVGKPANEATAITGSFPSPSECALAARNIEQVVELCDATGLTDLVPAASPAPLRRRGSTRPTPVPGRLPSALNHTLLTRAARSFTATARSGFEVTETWRGHSDAIHRYRTFDGRPVSPVFSHDGSEAADFGVCRDGHFYRPGTAAQCESCATWACPACDDVERQSAVPCPSCSSSVCRRCISTSHAVASEPCAICGEAPCRECGSDPRVQPCPICDREMCASCRSGELCPACSQLTTATEAQLRALPSELATAGATVLIGHDPDGTTLLINRGSNTVEQVVLRAGVIHRWALFGCENLTDDYRLRLAAGRMYGVQLNSVIERPNPDPAITVPHLVIKTERAFHPAWSIDDLDVGDRLTTSFPTTEGDLAHILSGEFPSTAVLPTPLRATPQQVLEFIAAAPEPSVSTLRLHWNHSGRDILATAAGLISRKASGTSLAENLVEWSIPDSPPAWAVATWNPDPTIRGYAAVDGVEVVVVGLASLIAAGIRESRDTDWYTIAASPNALAATMLARSMKLPDADEVSTCTHPTNIVRSTVTNAVHATFTLEPVGSVVFSPADRIPSSNGRYALESWLPRALFTAPQFGELPAQIRAALRDRFMTHGTQAVLKIGARISEVVTTEDGQVWRNEIELAPGAFDARRPDSATGLPLAKGVIDREGHYRSLSAQCDYCFGLVCSLCNEGLIECDCCGVSTCRRCVYSPAAQTSLCPTCACMRRPSWKEARQYGRLLSTRNMLIGITDPHHVVLERTKGGWILRSGDTEQSPISNPAIVEFLDERLIAKGPTG